MYVYIKVNNPSIHAELSHNVESLLVEITARYRRKVGHHSNPLVIFLHVDEIQRMSDDIFTVLRQNLTEFMAGDSVSAKIQRQIKVIPILTGVSAGLMVSRILSGEPGMLVSNSKIYLVTPSTLSFSSSKNLLRNVLRQYVKRGELEESQIELFMQNEGVICTLASLGGLPRPIEILAAVLVHADESIWSNREALFDAVVRGRISKTYGATSWVERLDQPVVHSAASKDAHDAMKQLMYLALTSQWVPLNTKLNEKGLTIQQAEGAGFCVLKQRTTKDGTRKQVQPAISIMWLNLINTSITNIIPTEFLKNTTYFTWNGFEEFVAHIFKIHINAMFAIQGNKSISLRELFPNINLSQSASKLKVCLKPIQNVWIALHKIPGKHFGDLSQVEARRIKGDSVKTIDITTGDAILVNGEKAHSFDICFVLSGATKNAAKLLFAIQVKHTEADAKESTTLSVDDFTVEQNKSNEAMKNCHSKNKVSFKQIFIIISNRDEGFKSTTKEDLDFEPPQSQTKGKEEEKEDNIQPKPSHLLRSITEAKEPVGLVFRPNFQEFLTPAFNSFAFLFKRKTTITSLEGEEDEITVQPNVEAEDKEHNVPQKKKKSNKKKTTKEKNHNVNYLNFTTNKLLSPTLSYHS